jgi:hypothetical protein
MELVQSQQAFVVLSFRFLLFEDLQGLAEKPDGFEIKITQINIYLPCFYVTKHSIHMVYI